MTRIISLIGSGDGIGKTSLAVGLAAQLAASGRRVCLLALQGDVSAEPLEADPRAGATLNDRLGSNYAAADLAVRTPWGFDLVAGGDSGWLRGLSRGQLARVGDALRTLPDYDVLLVDAGAGTEPNQLAFSLASQQLLVVMPTEHERLTDTYGLLKLLYAEQYAGTIQIVINKAENHTVGRYTYDKIREVSAFYLDMDLALAGLVGTTPEFPWSDDTRSAPAAVFSDLADAVLAQPQVESAGDLAAFCRRLSGVEGGEPDRTPAVPVTPVFAPRKSDDQLQQQLDVLSSQVDALIAEVDRLRTVDVQPTPQAEAAPAGEPEVSSPGRCAEACIIDIATRSERVAVDGESYSIYYLRKANGEQQRFACHSIDDDLEESAPRTHSS